MYEPKEGTYLVDPIKAAFWLKNYNYDYQRKIRQWHVQNLASEITFGRFLSKTQVNFCYDGDHYYLTNGQHTLSAISLANQAVVLNVIITPVKAFGEIADIYARHDTHLTRKLSDSLVAHQVDTELGVSKTMLSIITAGIVLFNSMLNGHKNFSKNQLTNDMKLDLIRKYGPMAARFIKDSMITTTSDQGVSYRTRKSSIAPCLFIYNHKPAECVEFITTTYADDGLKKGDPRKALIEFLKQSTTTGGATNMRRSLIVSPEHIIIKNFALAWNAFYKRKPLTYLRPKHEDREVYFEGCGMAKV